MYKNTHPSQSILYVLHFLHLNQFYTHGSLFDKLYCTSYIQTDQHNSTNQLKNRSKTRGIYTMSIRKKKTTSQDTCHHSSVCWWTLASTCMLQCGLIKWVIHQSLSKFLTQITYLKEEETIIRLHYL